MATTRFQAEVLKLIASSRVAKGASYIAGGLALNHQLQRPRLSSVDYQVLDKEGCLFRGSDDELVAALDAGEIIFHEGSYHGAWPTVKDPAPETVLGETI